MHTSTKWLLYLTTIAILPQLGLCFGAGQVGAELKGHAFLHGDLGQTLLKIAGVAFTKREVNAIYFGNWLRDYSQAMDVMGLTMFGDGGEAMAKEAILLVIQILSFMTFGYATGEFKVTLNKLGVYSHAEHIDNPIGYVPDAQKHHPRLRGEVFPDECAIDPVTGMKNYIAHENQGYNTSANYIRQTLKLCIAKGRSSKRQDCDDYYEALRLLGSALHTLEDFLAHTNWCELVIKKLSKPEANVFCFAGAETYIPTRSGELVPPLVTGTFGTEDFYVSVFGTVDDHLCSRNSGDVEKIRRSADQTSMPGLNKLLQRLSKDNPKLKGYMNEIADAKKLGEERNRLPRTGLEKLGESQVMTAAQKEEMEKRRVKARSDFRESGVTDNIPDESSNPAASIIWKIIEIRDDIVRAIIEFLEKIGLTEWVDQVNEIISKALWTIIAGIVTPVVDCLAGAVAKGHEDLLYNENQTAVFTKATCSDPTHTWLAKDHFKNSLHLPAARVAEVVVEDCVKKITAAWTNETDADSIINEILESFHHPYFPKEGSAIQAAMFQKLATYLNDLGDNQRADLLSVLTLEAVHQGKNVRDIPKNPGTLGGDVGDVVADVLGFGLKVADKTLEGLLDAIDAVIGVVDDVVEGVKTVVHEGEKVVDKVEGGLEKVGNEAVKTANDVKNGIEGAADNVEMAANRVYDGANVGLANIGNGAIKVATDVGGQAERIGDDVKELATNAQSSLQTVATDISKKAEELGGNIRDGAEGLVNNVGNFLGGLI